MEYNDLIDQAVGNSDPLMRLAYITAHNITTYTSVERNSTKPFNPLLGETYEFVNDKYRFFAEQVSHHPPISAYHCEGKQGYQIFSHTLTKSKFTGKNMSFY